MRKPPTRRRRNHQRRTYSQRGGDAIDTSIQNIIEAIKRNDTDPLKDIEDIPGIVVRLLTKEQVSDIEGVVLEKILLFAIEKDNTDIISTILEDKYASIVSPILTIIAKKIVKYATFEQSIRTLTLLVNDERIQEQIGEVTTLVNAIVAGNIDIVKVILQLDTIDPGADDNIALITAITEGHVDIVRLLLTTDGVDASAEENVIMGIAANQNNEEIMEALLELVPTLDPGADDNDAIIEASKSGFTEVVKVLLKDARVNPAARDNDAIVEASINGYADVVEVLLKDERVDPAARDNEAIVEASKSGFTDVVEMLLTDKRVDPSDRDNEAIISASENGYVEIVAALLKDERVDPAARDNKSIIEASQHGHAEVVEILMEDERVNPAARDNSAIIYATQENYEDVVKLLLKNDNVDPSVSDNMCIQDAAVNGNIALIDLFLLSPKVAANKNIFLFACEGLYKPDINAHIIEAFPDAYCNTEDKIDEYTLKYEPTIKSYNFIENDELPLLSELCIRDNIIIKATNSYFTLSRKDFEKNLRTQENTRFECIKPKGEEDAITVNKDDVISSVPYYYIQGMGNFLVRTQHLLAGMKKYSIIEMVKSDKQIANIAAYGVVQATPGMRLDNTPTEEGAYVSADHCQAGTQQNVYTIKGIILQI